MQGLDKTEGYGRKILIQFKCSRCGYIAVEDMASCEKRTGDRGCAIRQLSLPTDWVQYTLGDVVLCPECYSQYKEFMRGVR